MVVYLSPLLRPLSCLSSVFFFNDTATTEIYTLSLHDALPIWKVSGLSARALVRPARRSSKLWGQMPPSVSYLWRSEEHTSELQSRLHLVCRLLLEKKKKVIH